MAVWSRIVQHVHRRRHGVTLIELGVALAIIGILIAAAIPRSLSARKKAYKDEAYHLLQEVKTLEWGFYIQNSAFTGSLSSTGFVMPGGSHWSTPSLDVPGNQGQGGGNGGGNGSGSCNNGNGQRCSVCTDGGLLMRRGPHPPCSAVSPRPVGRPASLERSSTGVAPVLPPIILWP